MAKYIVTVEDFDPKDERKTVVYQETYDNLEDAQDDFDSLMEQGAEPTIETIEE